MAIQARCTVFLQLGNYGWTETYFTPASGYDSALTSAIDLGTIRATLLAGTAKVIGVRVSADDVFRDSLVQFFQPPLAAGFSTDVLHATTACLVRLVATPLVRRPLYLRALPIEIIDGTGAYLPTPTWLARMNALRTKLTNGFWQIKGLVGLAPPPRFNVASVQPPNTIITVVAIPGLAVGNIVYIGGSSRNRNPVGRHKVVSLIGPAGFTVSGVDLPADYVYHPFDLYAQLKTPSFSTITVLNDERLTERRTGRPFAQPRGRRSPVRV